MQLNPYANSYEELCAGFRWNVPARYNIAWDCCGRWAQERSRFALYYEDESGQTAAYSFWDLQGEANRLSNVLAALGVQHGDRVAIMLPQRPETAVAYIACLQMGVIAVPLSHRLGPEALHYRLEDSAASAAIVDAASLAALWVVRDKLPRLRHVIGVAGARESGVREWERLREHASSRYRIVDTAADDPALIIYAGGTTGIAKGALLAQRTLLGNLPGFVCSHDFFPQPGDMFWSPADWAWTAGLFGALLPAWHFGMPILAYPGRFDPQRAFHLIEKYGVRNAFLLPSALELMMKAVPQPRKDYVVELRSITSGGAALGEAVCHWARQQLGVTINEVFGQTEINYVVGGCAAVYLPRPGAIGRPYPGHRVALIDAAGNFAAAGEVGEIAVCRRIGDEADPVFMLGYWNDSAATAEKFIDAGGESWGRTGDLGKTDAEGYIRYQGRADDVFNSAGDSGASPRG